MTTSRAYHVGSFRVINTRPEKAERPACLVAALGVGC